MILSIHCQDASLYLPPFNSQSPHIWTGWGHWVFPVYWNIQIICLVQCILAFSVTCFNLFLCEVDWCIKGTSVAVARRNVLSILSTNFEEKVSISLPFRSWIGDSEENVSVKGLYFFPSFFLFSLCVGVHTNYITVPLVSYSYSYIYLMLFWANGSIKRIVCQSYENESGVDEISNISLVWFFCNLGNKI